MSNRSKAADDAVQAIRADIEERKRAAISDAVSASRDAARAMDTKWTSPDPDKAVEELIAAIEACGIYKGLSDADTIISDSSIVKDVDDAEEDD